MSYDPLFMQLALDYAAEASLLNEVPIGAVIVKEKTVIGSGRNMVLAKISVIAHAELIAITNASKNLKNYRLLDCDMYVTLEPCHMCAKAIVDARISNLYFGAYEPKTGSIQSIDHFLDKNHLNHKVTYSGGHMEKASAQLLHEFFRARR